LWIGGDGCGVFMANHPQNRLNTLQVGLFVSRELTLYLDLEKSSFFSSFLAAKPCFCRSALAPEKT
jgi:hypothetical protein